MYRELNTIGDAMAEVDKIQSALEWLHDDAVEIHITDPALPGLRDDIIFLLANYRELLKTLPIKK